ncbi:MAG: sigma-54-dependent Fis family transcriptional regulator [Chloracidobacterium sp.]|nr:sigma-54-dependent Fis family transcriptional regulator [Chloracidobacterium sp.]
MAEPKILIVDDEEAARYGMARALKNYSITEASSVEAARRAIAKSRPDLILLDNNLPGVSGLDYLRELAAAGEAPPVVMITAHGSERTAIAAIKAGAYDYLAKPFDVDELRLVVKNAIEASGLKRENERLRAELEAARGMGGLLGASDEMRHVYDLINKVAATDVTVLICGESGAGKELVARAIHERSAHRRDGDFIAMNCAALPSELIESELFGHERGAFTGAAGQRKGKFESASGGTIFLDEIGDMSLNTQAKLLRVLEDRKIERLGGSHSIPIDVRVISATNRDLAAAVAEEKFRADLYYRLRVVQIDLPPLRARREDIPTLAEYFLQTCSRRYQLKCVEISPDAMKRLVAYDWPGNVRELRNAIERSAVLADGKSLLTQDLPEEIRVTRFSQKTPEAFQRSSPAKIDEAADVLPIPYLEDFREARREFERAYIERALTETGGNVTRAAERVGMHRQSLQQKLKDLGLIRRYVLDDEAQDSDDE